MESGCCSLLPHQYTGHCVVFTPPTPMHWALCGILCFHTYTPDTVWYSPLQNPCTGHCVVFSAPTAMPRDSATHKYIVDLPSRIQCASLSVLSCTKNFLINVCSSSILMVCLHKHIYRKSFLILKNNIATFILLSVL